MSHRAKSDARSSSRPPYDHLAKRTYDHPCDFHPDRPATVRARDRWGAAHYCDDCAEHVRPHAAGNPIPAPDQLHRERLFRALAR